MKREQFTEKLARMVLAIWSGAPPARVRELYVFGSYARGALEPGDVDVIVIHDNPEQAYWDNLEREIKESSYSGVDAILQVGRRFESAMRRALRKPGEKIDIILTRKLEDRIGPSSTIRPEDLVLVWSESKPDYLSNLAVIIPDPSAGRAPRDHFIDLKRLYDRLHTMESTLEMLHKEELRLAEIPIEEGSRQLNSYHSACLTWWTGLMIVGKKSIRLLPEALWWLELEGQEAEVPEGPEIWSKSGTHRVHLGRPSLARMLDRFRHSPDVRRQCLIPHIKAGKPNNLLVFDRGRNWSEARRQEQESR